MEFTYSPNAADVMQCSDLLVHDSYYSFNHSLVNQPLVNSSRTHCFLWHALKCIYSWPTGRNKVVWWSQGLLHALSYAGCYNAPEPIRSSVKAMVQSKLILKNQQFWNCKRNWRTKKTTFLAHSSKTPWVRKAVGLCLPLQ